MPPPTVETLAPNFSTQIPLIKTVSSLLSRRKSLPHIKQLHAHILRSGLHLSVVFRSKLTDSYAKVGRLDDARQVFEEILHKNNHSWNSIMSGYSKSKQFSPVLHLYRQMRRENYSPDTYNLAFAIRSCSRLFLSEVGKSVHGDALKVGLDADLFVVPALIDMYVKFSCLVEARNLFDQVPKKSSAAWAVMMHGYFKLLKEVEAIELFVQMRELGIELDVLILVDLIQLCGNVRAGRGGSVFHGYCVKRKMFDSNVCLKTSIVDMYGKCGLLDSAQKLFMEMNERDVVLWSALVSGFAQNAKPNEALCFFRKMMEANVLPNMVTFASVLDACSEIGALQEGKSIHAYVVRNGVELDVVTYTAFVDMYSKCGSVVSAENIFTKMPSRNVYSWSTMINAFGINGLCSEALQIFDRMESENCLPNSVTFVAVLSACSHSGSIKEGWHYFEMMTRVYGIAPSQEHYSCMVDLFGRLGQIDDALSFINKMPEEPSIGVWGALLGACQVHKNVKLAEKVAKKMFLLDPNQPDLFVSLSNIYAANGVWDKVKKMRAMLCMKGLQKEVAYSLIEVENFFL
ncbi:hypothetical protein ACLOJK_024475 [Asimina triloba]